MKKILLIALLLLPLTMATHPLLALPVPMVQGINPIAFIPTDKAMHGAFAYAKTDWLETTLKIEWWQSMVAIYCFGLLKEQLDVACGGKWDWNDINADMIGWGVYRLVHFEWKF